MRRREFLKAAGATALMPTFGSGRDSDSRERGQARLLVGCCAYSDSKHFEADKLTMEDFFRLAAELGVKGVDVTPYWLKSTERAYLNSLRHLAFKNGLGFSGAAIRTEMCQSDPAKRSEQVRNIQHWTDVTDRLGASHLRVFTGKLPSGATLEQASSGCQR